MKKIFLLIALYCLMPIAVLAQQQSAPTEYQLLAPLPNITTRANGSECVIHDPVTGKDNPCATANTFLPGLFKLIIGIATALAVVTIMWGGVQYITSESFGTKADAKNTITNALVGLMLAMSAWVILNTLNPKLVEFNLSITPIEIKATPTTDTSGGNGLGGLGLSDAQVRSQLDLAHVITFPLTLSLANLKQGTVNEVIRMKGSCGCEVIITSATGGTHAIGDFSHENGYKVDLRSNREGQALTTYITKNYTQLKDRSDGAKMYQAPSGAQYALESDHWDVVVPGK